MSLLGMTDCLAVRELLEKGEIDLDYLEVHGPFLEDARTVFPVFPMLLHNSLYHWSLSHPDGLQHMEAGPKTIERLRLARSPWYSLHLGFSCNEVDFSDEAIQALSPTLPEDTIFDRMSNVLTQLTALLPVPVLIENMDYNPTGAYETVCRPDFIRRILEHTNTFFLLDLAHARVTASANGIPVEEYLAQLPLEKVRQIHLNRPGWQELRLVDAHLALEEEDYALFESVFERTHPWAVTLEYNRDKNRIAGQVQQLRQIMGKALGE
ncbi:MAG: hypothetical protein CVU46_15480 [Chloroflexi bacterium HGW-Chloroflexi-8]|jgi:hypothetical protein|nr:MAG: hypothetical protein CVU46_15480 [Chloroflexi bacterium HGW-Chloroflexi-8]